MQVLRVMTGLILDTIEWVRPIQFYLFLSEQMSFRAKIGRETCCSVGGAYSEELGVVRFNSSNLKAIEFSAVFCADACHSLQTVTRSTKNNRKITNFVG